MLERLTFEREIRTLLGGATPSPAMEAETFAGLRKRLKSLSFFPHWTKGGTAVPLSPSEMDPGFYDTGGKYKLAPTLQTALERVLSARAFRGLKVALVDLTKDKDAPEFAGVGHDKQVFIASVAKIATFYAAFQLQHDLRVIAKKNPTATSVFDLARDLWADTQNDPGGAATPFTTNISLRGKLVLVKGRKVPLADPRAPRLDDVFASDAAPFDFRSTPKTSAELDDAIKTFKRVGKRAIDDLGFLQRMMVVGGGLVPASNYAVSTLVRDLGFPYIASTLLQSGLYDPARGGGLWLGADYRGTKWRGAPGGGVAQSGTAGSLAAYMTLLAQGRVVSPTASKGILALIDKDTSAQPTLQSSFENALEAKYGPAQVYEKIGVMKGTDECAYIEWPAGGPTLKYVAVGLRSSSSTLEKLIVELHQIIAANNGVTLP